MKQQFRWPSAESPGFPSIEIELPADWVVSSVPDHAFMAISPKPGDDGFAANVVASVRRVSSSLVLEAISESVRDELQTLPDFAGLTDAIAEIGGRRASIKEYGFSEESVGTTVFQLQVAMLVEVDETVSDLVTLTVSHGSSGIDDAIQSLRELVSSVRLHSNTERGQSPG